MRTIATTAQDLRTLNQRRSMPSQGQPRITHRLACRWKRQKSSKRIDCKRPTSAAIPSATTGTSAKEPLNNRAHHGTMTS